MSKQWLGIPMKKLSTVVVSSLSTSNRILNVKAFLTFATVLHELLIIWRNSWNFLIMEHWESFVQWLHLVFQWDSSNDSQWHYFGFCWALILVFHSCSSSYTSNITGSSDGRHALGLTKRERITLSHGWTVIYRTKSVSGMNSKYLSSLRGRARRSCFSWERVVHWWPTMKMSLLPCRTIKFQIQKSQVVLFTKWIDQESVHTVLTLSSRRRGECWWEYKQFHYSDQFEFSC